MKIFGAVPVEEKNRKINFTLMASGKNTFFSTILLSGFFYSACFFRGSAV